MSFNIFGKLFGSDKVIGKAVDGIYNGIDSLVYTEEEKAERFQNLLKLYEPFKIGQRYLACICTIPYVFAWLITFLASFKLDVSDQITMLNDGYLGMMVLAINGFYFFGGSAEGGIKALMNIKK